jgi:hypothetical protein
LGNQQFMKYIWYVTVILFFTLPSCFPKDMKEKMAEAIQQSQVMIADQQFKTAVSNIEVFKLRNGYYPDSLREITFAPAFDTGYFNAVEYTRWADKYELNLKVIPKGFEPYPLEFWKGLGCYRSNVMDLSIISSGMTKQDSIQNEDSIPVN